MRCNNVLQRNFLSFFLFPFLPPFPSHKQTSPPLYPQEKERIQSSKKEKHSMAPKMMKWRLLHHQTSSSRFHVRMVVRSLSGGGSSSSSSSSSSPLVVEVRWKGPHVAWLRRPSRWVNRTREVEAEKRPDLEPVVRWNEEFQGVCSLVANRDGGFHPWEINLVVGQVNVSDNGSKDKLSILGAASLNLADFASEAKEENQLSIPLLPTGGNSEQPPLILHLNVGLSKLGMAQNSSEIRDGTAVLAPSSPPVHGEMHTEKEDVSFLMRKVKRFTDIVWSRKSKKTHREVEGSDDADFSLDTDSGDDLESQHGEDGFSIRKSFSYGSLASAKYIEGAFYCQSRMMSDFEEDWVFYNHRRRSDVGCSQMEESMPQTSRGSILSWRKRKLGFRTPKVRGVPLLNKEYGEEGGDDIDFDRRKMLSFDESLGTYSSSSSSSSSPSTTKPSSLFYSTSSMRMLIQRQRGNETSSASDFGGDGDFVIGRWETKEVVSRDERMKISSEVFFASIDQMSESVAGESACTVLVAVIADWFQKNHGIMPNQSQLDGLIRDGSSEWRKLCSNETYQKLFPDKHFDLETVLQAGIRPLSVSPSRSFIGFFDPEDIAADFGISNLLQGAMFFDNIWDVITKGVENAHDGHHPNLYIVSWNDHLFVLKFEPQAYYLIDTLGERLHEGCNQAYVIKFDDNTVIRKVGPKEDRRRSSSKDDQVVDEKETDEVVFRGKDSCREYIKNFLAAIPIRELQEDMVKGKVGANAIHHCLQIEFHYALPLQEQESS